MEAKTYSYKEALSELDTICNEINLYVNNNASVPEKLSNGFALSVIDVLKKFAMDVGQENLDRIYLDIDKYYDTLEDKISADIGPLSSIKKTLLLQGYTAIRNKLELYAASNYLDEQFHGDIMDISNFLNKSCVMEYIKTDHYRRKDFDYASYFFNLRNSSIDIAKEAYITAIDMLLTSTSDADFYHYLELCASCDAAFDAIVLL